LRTRCRSSAGVSAAWAAAILLGPAAALAHVEPSLNDNNRFVTLSVFANRVRLSYIVFFGEVPGAAQRRFIDSNRDGQLSQTETDAFAARLRAEVEAHLDLVVDGAQVPIMFRSDSFGAISQQVSGGAFSIDLVTSFCLRPAATHRLHFRDRFAVPRPGETELSFEDGPGITVSEASIGGLHASEGAFHFAGSTAALAEPGLVLAFEVSAEAAAPRDGECTSSPASSAVKPRRWSLPLLGGLAVVAAAIGTVWYRRRRRPVRPTGERATPS
jgi:hypothetical protein